MDASKDSEKSVPELLDSIYLDTTSTVDKNICKIISSRIRKKEIGLVKVVEDLGPRLTSTHVQERSKAVEILAHIFTYLPSDFLTEAELQFIVEFLCDRCKDQHIVIPKIIMCFLPVVKCKNLPKGAGAKLLDELFREANVQSHIHKIRHDFFKALQHLLGNRLEEIQSTSENFVMNFLQAMDGEKDPRTLLLLFRTIPCIVGKFELGPFLEDFYEILSCYFPIDFNPTVSVPGEEVITRHELASALHICLSQTNEFAEFLLPLTMEKLESSSVDAKIDALELLRLCCERSYLPQDLEPHLAQFWHTMRKEIFMGGNEEVEKKCYDFLKAAFKMISNDDRILNTCLAMIFSECKHHLSEPELRLIMPTSNILRCITQSGEKGASSVVQVVFPVLYEQICAKSVKSEKKRLLGIWDTLLSTCRQHKEIQLHSLVQQWDEMRALLFTLLTNEDWELVTLALKIFSSVIIVSEDFEQDQRDMLQEHILRLICTCSKMPHEARSANILLCKRICNMYGEEFSNTSIPRLLDTLSPSTSDAAIGDNDSKCEVNTMVCNVLGECSHLHQLTFQKVVSFLLERLEQSPLDIVYMSCLGRIVEKVCTSGEEEYAKPDLLPYIISTSVLDKVVSQALRVCKSVTPQPVDVPMTDITDCTNLIEGDSLVDNDASEWRSLRLAADIVRRILRAYGEQEQLNAVVLYWDGRLMANDDIAAQLCNIPGLLVEAILGPLRSTANISGRKELIKCILKKVLISPSQFGDYSTEFHFLPYVRLVGSLVNKAENDELVNEYLSEVEAWLEQALTTDASTLIGNSDAELGEKMDVNGKCIKTAALNFDEISRLNTINALVWIVKGLAMRGFSDLDVWVDKVIKLLGNEVFAEHVLNCVPSLVADDPYSLNPESFSQFKFLYKQRLFLMVVDKLVAGYRSASVQSMQFSYIRALSSQLKHVPSEILFMEIDSVLPLLVASLKCNSSSQVLLSTLNALVEMMNSPDTKDKLTEYSHDLVPQLTRLALYKESMDVRKMALVCLRKCAKAPSHVILPLRDTVIDNLVPCLDDSKRIVRQEATLTRNVWVLIGAPGGL